MRLSVGRSLRGSAGGFVPSLERHGFSRLRPAGHARSRSGNIKRSAARAERAATVVRRPK